MKLTRYPVLAALAVLLAAAACGDGSGDGDDSDGSGEPTPTPIAIPFEVCVAHFEVDVGDDPDVANVVLAVLLSEYWIGVDEAIPIDGYTGALYAEYHYNFDGDPLPEYVAAISTDANVVVTTTDGALGSTATLQIVADPTWAVVSGTAGTVSGGAGTVSGELQALADCLGGDCTYGTGGVTLLVNGSSLDVGTTHPDGVALLYCRDLPSGFAGWRPGQPLPPGFREVLR